MTAPPFRLATDDDMRAITSRNVEDIDRLPMIYIALSHLIPTEINPDAMKSWGVALDRTFADFARLYPEALVSPNYVGDRASRADLISRGAQPAAAFLR